jgi:DNA repair protein RadC
MKYSELPQSEQPKNRIRELGGCALTTAELMAVALRIKDTEAAAAISALYHECGGIGNIPREKITEIAGLGDGYADSIEAIREIVSREVRMTVEERPSIHSPQDAARLVQYDMSCLDREEMWVMTLDTRNKVIRIHHLYKGTLNSSNVRVAEIFKTAIIDNAAAIIVFHNHPSQDPSPSPVIWRKSQGFGCKLVTKHLH